MSALYSVLNSTPSHLMMISPIVFKPERFPTAAENEELREAIVALLLKYAKYHGLEVTVEELGDLLEEKIFESVKMARNGLGRFHYYQTQQQLQRQQVDDLARSR